MAKDIPFENARFVYSSSESNYQEIIDSFSSAEWIDIVTYSIYDDNILELLKDVPENCFIRVITNIPTNAKKNEYMIKLNPIAYNKRTSVFFCKENHAKLIMTDKLAYVGSENFASSGYINFGVISDNHDTIQNLHSLVYRLCMSEKTDSYYFIRENRQWEMFKLQNYLPVILKVLDLVTKAKMAYFMEKQKQSDVSDGSEFEVKAEELQEYIDWQDYLYSLDMNQIKMVQYISFIGREYFPDDYAEQRYGDSIIPFFFDDYYGASKWKDKADEINEILRLFLALPEYIKRGLRFWNVDDVGKN